MKYDELSVDQKDALVAQKVMGWQPIPCDGQVDPYMGSYWSCTCGWISKEHIWDGGTGHDRAHPPYSTNMDAAWQVIQEMNKPINGSYARYAAFCDAIERIIGSNLLFDILYCDALGGHLTADRICRAALYALGVLYDNGEVVEVQS